MNILVLSDSHSSLCFMRRCIEAMKPDLVLHLGDYYDDALALKQTFPAVRLCHVPGNCDRFRCPPGQPESLLLEEAGVRLFLTHGHRQHVKSGIGALLREARAAGAQAALYGHTHRADCHREEDGLWVLNPGSCGYGASSAGWLTVRAGQIEACRLLGEDDLPTE